MLIGFPKDFTILIFFCCFFAAQSLKDKNVSVLDCLTLSITKIAYWLFTLGGSPGCWARSLQLERCLFPRSCPQTPLQGDGAAFPALCWFIQDVYLFDQLFVCQANPARGEALFEHRVSHWVVESISLAYRTKSLSLHQDVRALPTGEWVIFVLRSSSLYFCLVLLLDRDSAS